MQMHIGKGSIRVVTATLTGLYVAVSMLSMHASQLSLQVRAQKPAFHADLLLRYVSSGADLSKDERKRLIEEAFSIAGAAPELIALKRVGVGGDADSLAGVLSAGARLGVDVVSLRARAAQFMLRLDRIRARQ